MSLLDDLNSLGTDRRPLAGSTFFETNPVRVAGGDANPSGGSDVTVTSSYRFDQPIDATDPSNITVSGPLGGVADVVGWIGNNLDIVVGFIAVVVLLYLLQPILQTGATVTEAVVGGDE